MPERALTVHAGFYPQLARNLTGKFSYNRGVSRGKGGYTHKSLGGNFAEHVRQLVETEKKGFTEGAMDWMNPAMLGMTSRIAGPIPTALGATRLGTLGRTVGVLGSVMEKYTGKKLKRDTRWKDVVANAEQYDQRHKKYTLRGNYVWYTEGTTGPKDVAERLMSLEKNQSGYYGRGERWYTSNISAQQGNSLRQWAERILGIDGVGNYQGLQTSDIQAMHDDAAEEVIQGPYRVNMEDAPNPEGTARPRDYMLDGKAIESTEQSGISHGLVGKFPIKGAKSNDSPAQLKKYASAWKKYMTNDVVRTWNAVVKKLVSKGNMPLEKLIKKSGKELKKEVKQLAKTGGPNPSKNDISVRMAANMNTSFFRNLKHNVANEGKTNYAGWVEGIPISERDESTGKRLYASTDISSELAGRVNQWIRYKVNKVQVLDAISHGHGLMAQMGITPPAVLEEHYLNQQITYAHGANNNVEGVTHSNGVTMSGMNGLQASARTKMNTSVSKKLSEAVFQSLEKRILRGLRDKIVEEATDIKAGLAQRAESDGSLFWASPYVGIEEGLYISR